METRPLFDKVAVVTGGCRGIGKATSSALARAGSRVVATSRSAEAPPASVPRPGEISEAALDVRSEQSVDMLFSWIEAELGRLDLLVNNAGAGVFKPLEALSVVEWRSVIDTNLTGAFLCSRRALALMKEGGGGRIISIGSVADHAPLPDCAAYAASKFGLRGLTGVLTEEGKGQGVFASLLSPGATATDIWQGRSGFDPKDMLDPDDVASAVLYVACQPEHARIDEIRLMPRRGIL